MRRLHVACAKKDSEYTVVLSGVTHILRMRDFANTDKVLAKKLSTDSPIDSKDIPNLRRCCGIGSSMEIIERMLEAGFTTGKLSGRPDTEIARIFSIGRHKVAEVRNRLGIEAVKPSDFRSRSLDWESVVGDLLDPNIPHRTIADKLKTSAIAVYRRRKKLVESGTVPADYMAKWGLPGKQPRAEF